MSTYEEFLRAKAFTPPLTGMQHLSPMNQAMFPHQRDVCSWALKMGRSAAFLGTGMGKTLIELEWAKQVHEHTKLPVLILAPLAVAQQTVNVEAPKFGVKGAAYHLSGDSLTSPIVVTNYDRLELFNPDDFAGVVLDESSILKAMDGKTRTALIESFRNTPFRLCATATPAPNDYMELGNHSEFLGVMTAAEMLAMFFVHDGGETQKWRLKGHARKEFWKWVCSWAVSMRKPSDIGYSDEGFELPPIRYHEHIIDIETPSDGMLFAMPAESLQERIAARRSSVEERVREAAEVVAAHPEESWLLWCNLNAESEGLTQAIPGAVQVTGSDDAEHKESCLVKFASGELSKLVSKPSICGFGMNLQICSHLVFVGISDSWEQFYQAVRRCWRFGQKRPVHVHIIAANTEGNVLENLKRKEKEASEMAEEMAANTRDFTRMNLKGFGENRTDYQREMQKADEWEVHLSDCIDLAKEIPDNSVHYSIYSPPFESLYTYSSSERDMGNSRDSEQFWEHYRFLIAEQFRAMMPGRLVSIHCMNLPTSKVRQGYIGIRDFRGEIIRAFEDAGFIYHSEVCIWKDPVTAMQRTKALGLLHKQLKKDAAMSRQGIPDYLVTMRKPGDNPEPVTNTNDSFPVKVWQRYASPVWMDIDPSDTLTYREAREFDDERHICPLQLEVIRRGIRLWSNANDLIWSPFSGIGSEGYEALKAGRRFIGSELKRSYYEQSIRNLKAARALQDGLFANVPEAMTCDPGVTQGPEFSDPDFRETVLE